MPVTEFFHVQNLLCVQDLRYPILEALLHGTRAVHGRQPDYELAAWYKECN